MIKTELLSFIFFIESIIKTLFKRLREPVIEMESKINFIVSISKKYLLEKINNIKIPGDIKNIISNKAIKKVPENFLSLPNFSINFKKSIKISINY